MGLCLLAGPSAGGIFTTMHRIDRGTMETAAPPTVTVDSVKAWFATVIVAFTTSWPLIVVTVILAIARFIWSWKKRGGRRRFVDCVDRRQTMHDTMKTLPEEKAV